MKERLQGELDDLISHAREEAPEGESTSRPLSSRLAAFATEGPESRYGWVRVDASPTGIPGKRRKWGVLFTDDEVAEGKRRNAVARQILAERLQPEGSVAEEPVQKACYEAFLVIWVDAPALVSGGGTAQARREEDGIPSAEALLGWFAENEAFCESVRAEAKARLEKLERSEELVPENP